MAQGKAQAILIGDLQRQVNVLLGKVLDLETKHHNQIITNTKIVNALEENKEAVRVITLILQKYNMPYVDLAVSRRKVANAAFETLSAPVASDIEDHDGWDVLGNTWRCNVFWKNVDTTQPSIRGHCIIQFKPETAEVSHQDLHKG
tara:strand:+ start:5174 stop:5611 length:438 start_codon:yes stop_codon:yes gene_type:complete